MERGMNMKIKNMKQKLLFAGVIGISIILLFFVITSVWIGYDVKQQCLDAKREYGKQDCVEALITLLNDEHRGYRVRNNAIWALGQLGDERALPTLQTYYTGNIPPREPLDGTISQYELKKAVNLVRGGVNITAPFWRYTLR
jgi:hypothetical protein